MGSLAAALFAATFIQKGIDWFRNGIDVRDRVPKVWWQTLSFAYGCVMAWALNLDVFSALSSVQIKSDVVRIITSGIALGAGGSFLHDLTDGQAPAATPKGFTPNRINID